MCYFLPNHFNTLPSVGHSVNIPCLSVYAKKGGIFVDDSCQLNNNSNKSNGVFMLSWPVVPSIWLTNWIRMAKYSLYFLFNWSWKRISCFSYKVFLTWIMEMPLLFKLFFLPQLQTTALTPTTRSQSSFDATSIFCYLIIDSNAPPHIWPFFNILFPNWLESYQLFYGTSHFFTNFLLSFH